MAKIRAVLDQETWVEVDVPDEFQAIVTSLICSETSTSENPDDAQGNTATSYDEAITNDDSSLVGDNGVPDAQKQIKRVDSSEIPSDVTGNDKSRPEKNKSDVVNSLAQNNNSTKERGKSTSHTLLYKGVGYHMVNWLVILFNFLFRFSSGLFIVFHSSFFCS